LCSSALTCAVSRKVVNPSVGDSRSSWIRGATRFLKDYGAESQDAATATERAFANAFSGAEDALVGFISSGKLEFQRLADSILADLARMTVRQTLTAPLAGALQGAFAGGGLFGLFHEGGIAGERHRTAESGTGHDR
jgi:lambda family phage tail tape measure protein